MLSSLIKWKYFRWIKMFIKIDRNKKFYLYYFKIKKIILLDMRFWQNEN